MKSVKEENCFGCGACVVTCPKKAISLIDNRQFIFPTIDHDLCVDCGLCVKVCPKRNTSCLESSSKCYSLYAKDIDTRRKSASGGAATLISNEFIVKGGLVSGVVCENKVFSHLLSSNSAIIQKFSGSKYVKSDTQYVYSDIKRKVKDYKILFIGTPCQVAGLKNIVSKEDYGNLYTIDLICHGTPTQRLFDIFISQYSGCEIKNIGFRIKNRFGVYVNEKDFVSNCFQDFYTIGFLKGLTYNLSCYNCPYAKKERIGDLTIGDFWGLDTNDKHGISLVLCNTDKGNELLLSINNACSIKEQDIDIAYNNNEQLNHPMFLDLDKRTMFYKRIEKKSFNLSMKKAYRFFYYKQQFKHFLVYRTPLFRKRRKY